MGTLKIRRLLLWGTALALGALAPPPLARADSRTVVEWGGNYVSHDSNVRGYTTPITYNVDLGDGYFGARWYCPYSGTDPLTPQESYGTGTSWRFFGGVVMESYTNEFAYKWAEIWNQPNGDQQYCAGPVQTRGWDLRYWKHEDFLAGGATATVQFRPSSQLEVLDYQGGDGIPGDNSGRVRFVVQDLGQFYVSEAYAGPSGDPSADFILTDPGSRRWAPYNPLPPYAIKFDAANAVFTARTFLNITAVGVLHSNDNVPPPATGKKGGSPTAGSAPSCGPSSPRGSRRRRPRPRPGHGSPRSTRTRPAAGPRCSSRPLRAARSA